MTTNNSNDERENRDGNDSSPKRENGDSPIRKKRTRVGDLRRQSFDVSPSDRDRNPYSRPSDSRPERPTLNPNPGSSDERRPYDGGNQERRPFNSQDRSDYNRRNYDNQGGYNNNRGGQGGGYNGNRGNTGGGYNNNRGGQGGYENRGGNTGGGYNNRGGQGGGYDNRGQQGGGYNNRGSQGGGYDNRGGQQGGGYNNNRGGQGGGYNNRGGQGGGYDNRGGQGGGYNNNRGGQGGGYDNRNQGQSRGFSSAPKRIVKPVKYKENIDPTAEIRLNKYLANAGVCSRREADSFITSGLVKVNGEVVNELGSKILYGDIVSFNDQPISLESKVYVLLNKPRNCVTTSDDPQNRTTVMDMVKGACPERIYPVGRLDRNTTGVLLLTNDGDLASKLMHPKYKKKKIYQVTLDKDVTMEDMQKIADGIELDDGEIHADSIAYNSEDALNVVGIEIHSGRNRIVRRIFEKLNYQVIRLDRVYFAGLTKKNVPRGKWRYLSEKEVNMLRMGAFE